MKKIIHLLTHRTDSSRAVPTIIYFKIGLLMLLLAACSPTVRQIQKNCDKYALICKQEPKIITHDSIQQSTVIVYRDTTIIVQQDPDTIIKHIPVILPNNGLKNNELEIWTKFGTAKAYIQKNELYLAFIPDTTIVFYLKNALRDQIIKTNNYKTTMETSVISGHKFDWNRFLAWLIVGIVVLFTLYQVIKRYL